MILALKSIVINLDLAVRDTKTQRIVVCFFLHIYRLIGVGAVSIPRCLKISNLVKFVVMIMMSVTFLHWARCQVSVWFLCSMRCS